MGSESEAILIVPVTGAGDARTLPSDSFVPTIQWMRDGRLVSGSASGALSVWDSQSGELQQQFEGHTEIVASLTLTPKRGYSRRSSDRSIRVWDLASGAQVVVLEGHSDQLRCIDISADARLAASHDRGVQVRLWRLDTLACIADIIVPSGWLSTIQFHPTEPWLAVTGHGSNTVSIYELDVDA